MVSSAVPTVDTLVTQVHSYLPDYDAAPLRRAYHLAQDAHDGQLRKTGEPYFTHCVATAAILADLKMDPAVVVAGLLHDVIEDTTVTADTLQATFGEEVALLVNGVTKLSKIADVTGHRKRDLGQREAESLRKMFLAMGEDIRVVPVKLADRLHNMRTLHGHSREKQIRIARETLDIFAPLANRLGIWEIKWELEDLCLRYLEPEMYESLVEGLNEQRDEREALVAEVAKTLGEELAEEEIRAEISGRSKHLYSIFKKMRRKDSPLEKIFDVRAVRIIIEDDPTVDKDALSGAELKQYNRARQQDCYAALGVVHRLWRPIPSEFDDYIANPKGNGYRSLHTAILGPKGRPIEVQIRDRDMHHDAEYGVCAHWRYKEQHKGDRYLDEKVRIFRQMLDWQNEDEPSRNDAKTFVDNVKGEMGLGHVFVFTPKGEVKELPVGATPIDFAYYIHTDIGHHCTGAKVNGVMVGLDYTLQNGDRVEVVTSKNRKGPSRDWLNPYTDFVKTPRARSKIAAWFRHQGRDEKIKQGRESLEREMHRLGVKERLEKLASHHHFAKLDDFFAALGAGDLNAATVAGDLLDRQRQKEAPPAPERGVQAEVAELRESSSNGGAARANNNAISLDGMGGLMIRYAGCCSPVSGDPIVGYITRGNGITVHREDCAQTRHRLEDERLLTLAWGAQADDRFDVPLRVLAFDRDGLLRDIGEVVANEHISMDQVTAITNRSNNTAIITATLGVQNVEQLQRVIARVRGLQNVIDVQRASG